ncbi:MAG: TolC family protein, partial [Vicinamibacterales bacterium]
MPADTGTISAAVAERAGVDPRGWPDHAPRGLPSDVSLRDGLTIDEAVAAALWNNPAFQVTLADLGFARAELIDARMLRNPVLSFLFPIGPKQLEATLNWPIDALFHRPRRVAAATLDYQSIAARLVADALGLVTAVKRTYVATATAERRAGLARETAEVAGRVRTIADARFKAGDISDLEARATRAEALIAEATARSAEHDRDLARIRLRALIGVAPDAPVRVTPLADLPMQACGDLDSMMKDALAARPDVRAAEIAVEAAGARAGLARAQVLALTAILDANGAGREGFEWGPGLSGEL